MQKSYPGSRRARLRPPKKEEKKGKLKRRLVQFLAVVLVLIMAFSGLLVLFTK